MLREIDFSVFKGLVPLYLYNDIDYLSITANVIGARAVFYVYGKNNEELVAFSLFKRGNKIVLPSFQIFYSGIWLKYSLEHKNGRDNLYNAINCLKERYSQIKLMLPVEFFDVRPFIWNNFSITLRYTYLKDTSLYLSYKKDVKSNYKNSKKQKFAFSKVYFENFNWNGHSNHLLEMGYTNRNVQVYKKWFYNLDLKNKLLCFQVTDISEIVVGSGVLLLDSNKKTAYFILRNIPKGRRQKEINAFVYIEVLKWLNANGYDHLDYMGANMRNIADFKERFLPALTPYYIVEFKSKRLFSLHGLKKLLRTFLIKYFKY